MGSNPPETSAMEAFFEKILRRLERTSAPGPKLKDPETFNGTKSRYSPWKFVLQQYVAGLDKDRAISVVLSYIQGERVDIWKEAFSRSNYENGAWKFDTLNAFWKALDTVFDDPNVKHTAQAKLESLKMKGSAQEFFTEFEQLVTLANYDLDNEFVLNILQRNAREDFVRNIYARGNIPTTFAAWKTRLLGLDKYRNMFNVIRHGPSRIPTAPTTQRPNSAPNPPPQPQPIPVRRDGTGIIYGGRGQPMDLDRKCIKCSAPKREKGSCGDAWHIPNRSSPNTQYRRRWEEAEESKGFFEEVRRFVKEDPELFLQQVQGSTPEPSFVEDST
ncbi:hypothetical protein BN946_scf184640.g18 [Trametes cinnabarina]|uniref:Retrotransposon gag domain-containing protein n=1 Tax=Pycnoporus cinnabarinus TaxID=5643 RepID=A0A060SRG0_PYCCI|nr:hypothetical protein BN946_scf184640.g18 [Trametes cinnabarina]